MAESSVISIPDNFEMKEIQELPPTPQAKSPVKILNSIQTSNIVIDKTLSSAANLVKLLPTGTVLAFHALSPSFSNKGSCYPSNKYLITALIAICTLSCLFFSFTDTLTGSDGKIYHGIATFQGFWVFNDNESNNENKRRVFKDLKRFRIRPLDYVHAFFSIIVFFSLTFSDSDIQKCLFPSVGWNARELLVNLPLGAAILSSLVFMTFPTSRKGIGYSDSAPHS